MQDVASLASVELVVAGVAGAAASEHPAVDQIVALLPGEPVGPVTALKRVLSRPAADDVVATVAQTWSCPARAAITSAPGVPLITSAPCVPTIVAVNPGMSRSGPASASRLRQRR